jgi:hypothetical protein
VGAVHVCILFLSVFSLVVASTPHFRWREKEGDNLYCKAKTGLPLCDSSVAFLFVSLQNPRLPWGRGASAPLAANESNKTEPPTFRRAFESLARSPKSHFRED